MKVFSRARCGLRPPARGYSRQASVTFASIHHGGVVGGPRPTFLAGKSTWRGWQDFHINGRGWSDIAYTFGIDGLGRLYEGRPWWAVPAAVENHNSGSVAFVFMQDGDRYKLNWAQRRTLQTLFEKGLPSHGIPPLRKLDVWGHKEFSGHGSNKCPGSHILRHLKWRRGRYS
jgi:hypothetical protein